MSGEYVPPSVNREAFNCPHCGAYAKQTRGRVGRRKGHRNYSDLENAYATKCANCSCYCLWVDGNLVFPEMSTAPQPHEDMPSEIRRDYTEARQIVDDSPRAAAALLRLGIQRLLENHLEADGDSLYRQIGNLEEDGRISPRVQKALDSVRVIGNNSVHPGKMDMDDNKDTAEALFMLLNEIIDETLGRENRIDKVYDSLPEGSKEGIEQRKNQ